MRIRSQRLTALEQRWTIVGCPRCWDRPPRVFLVNHDPDPPVHCTACGRHVIKMVRRYILIPGEHDDGEDGGNTTRDLGAANADRVSHLSPLV